MAKIVITDNTDRIIINTNTFTGLDFSSRSVRKLNICYIDLGPTIGDDVILSDVSGFEVRLQFANVDQIGADTDITSQLKLFNALELIT